MNVLVTGGAGYIGSHAVRSLLKAGHHVVVLDDLSTGHRAAIDRRATFINGHVGDRRLAERVLMSENIEAVLHFAARIEVAESMSDPLKHYRNNVAATIELLEAMRTQRVMKFIFSSTAAVYGNPTVTPIPEDHECHPINPYGRSKKMAEWIISDCSKSWGLGACIFRYFNVAGASPDGTIGEDHQPESHLIPRILLSVAQPRAEGRVQIYGTNYPTADGTCVRDYVHVEDLVDAHTLALHHVSPAKVDVFNLGSEHGFSVREVIQTCRKVTGATFHIEEKPPRAGDPTVLLASSEKARAQLGWSPRHSSLETMLTHAWNWHRSHPTGFDRDPL